MPYWPSYGAIAPQSRAAYLQWLAGGRRSTEFSIGYVFLYFYGLERRVLVDAVRSEEARADLPAIHEEIEGLLGVYGANRSFERYARQLLDVVCTTLNADVSPPHLERGGYESPLSVRVPLGKLAREGKPVPAEWAFVWVMTHPTTSVRTPARRCAEEFRALFLARYTRQFGEGIVLKDNRSKLVVALTPASASFGGQVTYGVDVPDIDRQSGPMSKLQELVDTSAADLDAYSRWLGRHAGVPAGLAAAALLPAELVGSHQSEEVQGLWHWLETALGAGQSKNCSADELLGRCASLSSDQLLRTEAALLAQLLEKGGYGLEPDVRFGGTSLLPGGRAVIFKLPPGAAPVASPGYMAAATLVHLAVAVTVADGTISESERDHLTKHVERSLDLSQAERIRLAANLALLLQSPPRLTGLKKRLEPLDREQRATIADFAISVAGADGRVSREEIKVLGKIHAILGLGEETVYSRVHAMSTGADEAQDATPPVIMAGDPTHGYAIPKQVSASAPIELNMAIVESKLAQSASVAALLGGIFSEEAVPVVSAPPEPTGKLTTACAGVLAKLIQRADWSRTEFESLVAEERLMPDAVVDALNEAAFEHAGGPVLEGDDPLQVDEVVARELLA